MVRHKLGLFDFPAAFVSQDSLCCPLLRGHRIEMMEVEELVPLREIQRQSVKRRGFV
jgi:hypothetical protein